LSLHRHAVLAALAAGLAAAPMIAAPAGWAPLIGLAGVALALIRRRADARAAAIGWLACAIGVAAVAGLGLGGLRLAAIDAGAYHGDPGARVSARGFPTATARHSFGEARVPFETVDGRLMLVIPEPVGELPIGRGLAVRGVLAEPEDFRADELARAGAALELRADAVRSTGAARGGLSGALDGIRERAETGIEAGMGTEGAALARGFVLGEDDRIDPETRTEFKRSGLAHLLAVSGQNVLLLAILAGAMLGLLGVRLVPRLILTLGLIAVYVPVAGGGSSIQRAGVMGAAAILAALAGRPSDRAYLPLLAAVATLAVNPRFGSDVGWQLSFAAVVGIMLWGAPLAGHLARRFEPRLGSRIGRALAEGIALTLAATVATAPLMALHFEAFSIAGLVANVVVLPAVAPVMWLGMLAALLGQIPGAPTAPIGAVEDVLVRFVAGVAERMAAPAWAQVGVGAPGPITVVALYAAIGIATLLLARLAARRRGAALGALARIGVALLLLAAGLVALANPAGSSLPERAGGTLRITEIDVGQGDATLLQPPRGDAVLVDGGPPGGGLLDGLRRAGVDRLAAVVLTHDQLDHEGGLYELFGSMPVDRFIHSWPAPRPAAAARGSGAQVIRVAEGTSIRFGRLALDVLWPPREPPLPGANANAGAIVLRARFDRYATLLTADAEFEQTHIDPGPVDVLKVAHHGSDDAGLEPFLERSLPRVALIGVGAENTYGHPTPGTIGTLAGRGVCVLRTDLDGDAGVDIGPAGVTPFAQDPEPLAAQPGCAATP
jgi:competence protein ComEC